jgi:hypothetical protein
MLSIEECKKTLNKDGIEYTDEEVKEIREFLYIVAEIDYNIFQRKREEEYEKVNEPKVVQLITNQNTQADGTESDSLHPGIYRRAS